MCAELKHQWEEIFLLSCVLNEFANTPCILKYTKDVVLSWYSGCVYVCAFCTQWKIRQQLQNAFTFKMFLNGC